MVRYRFSGQRLLADLGRFEDNLLDKIGEVVHDTARLIQSEARARAPVDLGNLRQSIEVERVTEFMYRINVGANYGLWVEYGTGIYAEGPGGGRDTPWSYYSEELNRWVTTRGSRAQPFWFPALEIGEKYFNRELSRLGL